MGQNPNSQTASSTTAEAASFTASRFTSGNFLFPTTITITPVMVVRTKRSWLSKDEASIAIKQISSVRIKTGVLFSEIWVESTGGINQIYSHGHSKGDAQEVKRLIERYQLASQ